MEDNERRRRSWSRFRLATLFWITLAIACFFAGVHWHDELQSIVRRKYRGEEPVTLRTGESIRITTPTNVPKLMIENEAVATVQPVSATEFQVTGRTAGSTTVTVWDEDENETPYRIVVVR